MSFYVFMFSLKSLESSFHQGTVSAEIFDHSTEYFQFGCLRSGYVSIYNRLVKNDFLSD